MDYLLKLLWYREPLGERLQSVFHRKKSNFAALDGIRAIAIIWVYLGHIHNDIGEFEPLILCIVNPMKQSSILKIFFAGDMGVDLFFILSGFLIAFLLLKEAQKTDGHINYGKFLLGRITRLWFAVLPLVILCWITKGWQTGVSIMLFLNNFAGETT